MEDKPYNRSSDAYMQIVQIRLPRVIQYRTLLYHRFLSRKHSADKAPKAFMECRIYNRSNNADMQIVQVRLLRVIQYRTYTVL